MKRHSLLGLAYMTMNTISGNALGSDDNKLSERYFMRAWVSFLAKKVAYEIKLHEADPIDPALLRTFCVKLQKDTNPFCSCSAEKAIWSAEIPKVMTINGVQQIDYVAMAGGGKLSVVNRSQFEFSSKAAPWIIPGYISANKLYVTLPAEQLNCEVTIVAVPQRITETSTCAYNYLAEFDIKEEWVADVNLQIAQSLGIPVQQTKAYTDKRNDGTGITPQQVPQQQ